MKEGDGVITLALLKSEWGGRGGGDPGLGLERNSTHLHVCEEVRLGRGRGGVTLRTDTEESPKASFVH